MINTSTAWSGLVNPSSFYLHRHGNLGVNPESKIKLSLADQQMLRVVNEHSKHLNEIDQAGYATKADWNRLLDHLGVEDVVIAEQRKIQYTQQHINNCIVKAKAKLFVNKFDFKWEDFFGGLIAVSIFFLCVTALVLAVGGFMGVFK